MAEPLDVLIDELCREINRGSPDLAWDDEAFFAWAERIARAQVGPESRIGRALPQHFGALEEFPAVTTDTYRFGDTRAFTGDLEPTVVFRTSGTTARHRGRHVLYRTDIYRASALAAFDRLVDPDRRLDALVSLVPPRELLPDSSLAFMIAIFADARFAGRTRYAVGPAGLDGPALREALSEASGAQAGPILLFATTLAAHALLELDISVPLPEGSLILTTGGAKGRSGAVDPARVESELARRFPGTRPGAEYGMTELLSQAYRVGSSPYRLPPWCRVLAIDPTDGRRLPHGRSGLLRFVDLANAQSALAVQTADLGRTHSDHTFSYVGRAPGAQLRGCSLSYEELEEAADD